MRKLCLNNTTEWLKILRFLKLFRIFLGKPCLLNEFNKNTPQISIFPKFWGSNLLFGLVSWGFQLMLLMFYRTSTSFHGHSQDFFGGGGTFRKFFKNFLRKLRKMHYFSKFFKKFNKPCVKFLRVWTKNANCWDLLRKFSNIFKVFLKKIAKSALFWHIFQNI